MTVKEPVFDPAQKLNDESSEQYIQRFSRERDAYIASLTLLGEHYFAALGSETEKGGKVVSATSGMEMNNIGVALVGDKVRYPDGREEKITSGTGFACLVGGVPVAIVGSHVSGRDRIVSTPEKGGCISNYKEIPIDGFLDENYVWQKTA